MKKLKTHNHYLQSVWVCSYPAFYKYLFQLAFVFLGTGQVLAQGFTVSESSLTTTEDGVSISYTVVLTSQPDPGEMVTVTPASTDVTEGTVSGPLVFDQNNWNVPQPVTITPGASGDGFDGDVMYTINNAAMSSGGSYTGIMAASVTVTNINIDGLALVIVDPSSAIIVDEEGTMTQTVDFSVGPTVTPTADVTVTLVNNTPSEVTLSTPSVVLTSGNGYSASVIITGISDMIVEGTQPFSITTNAATSSDASFNGVNPVDIAGKVIELPTVPTLGQWGLIILSLLLTTFGVVALRSRQTVLAGVGTSSFPTGIHQLPFDKVFFGKMLIYTMIGLAAVFAVAIGFFGYEMTTADVPGSLVAGPLLAYLLHLLVERRNNN